MIYPTIKELTKDGDYNRYEIALATAKCARMIMISPIAFQRSNGSRIPDNITVII